MSKDHWKLKKLVDSSINTQPLFVHDDSKIILVQGSIIKAVSAETGGLLSQVRNDFDVKFVVMHPTHNNQCIAVLQNNSLCSWDIDECSLTILGQLKGNVVGLHTSSIKTTSVFLIVNLNVGRCTTIVEFDLMRQVQLECYRYNGHCSNSCVGLRNGNCIFALQIQEDILFFAEDIDIKRMEFKVEKIATSMTFHPKDATFVVGDKSGRIHFFDIEESVKPTSVRHWHAHSVHCIGYDHNGDLFFSGGEENTVVIWNLNNGGKNFLPRLGGMILHFAPNHAGNAFVIVTENNTIRTFESSLTERWTIRGISASSNVNYDLETASELTGGLLFDPRSRSVVLSGAPGSASLQLFDVFKEMHLMDIDIGHRNPISRTQLSKLKPLIVDNVSFSQNGMQMVTTERRSLADGDETTTMKFWDYLPGRHTFCLNTRIDNPHESRITGVKFHPTGEYVVTASLDGHFKTWISVVSESPTQKGKSTKQWTGLSNGYWQDHKGLSSIDISEDGSFMALAYGPIITLWEPKTNRLRHTLSHPPPEYDLRFVQFIPKTSYVVGVSKSMVHVWNVVSLDVWWSSTVSFFHLTDMPMFF
eukprot:TRINITY_DN11_c0_g1_i2.p1 TRINITY_DN11_c0_g1~~TRINITY_DN11_c0_g1_i2.p1  ORF type:complete len:587 (+),score=51.90 TRINITY_DN11_c0_g1_i2:45-1805(+)